MWTETKLYRIDDTDKTYEAINLPKEIAVTRTSMLGLTAQAKPASV